MLYLFKDDKCLGEANELKHVINTKDRIPNSYIYDTLDHFIPWAKVDDHKIINWIDITEIDQIPTIYRTLVLIMNL